MAITARSFIVAANTSTGTQALSLAGETRTPAAYRIRWTSGTSDLTIANEAQIGCGGWDGTRSRCSVVVSLDNQPATSCGGRNSASNVIETLTGGSLDGVAAHSSVSAGTATINWTTASTAAILLEVTLYFTEAGDEIRVDSWSGSTTLNGTTSITGMSNQPNGAYFFSTNDTTTGAFTSYRLSEGVASDGASIKQGCKAVAEVSGTDPTAPDGIVVDNRCSVRLSGAGAIDASIELTAWNSDGVTLTTRTGGGFAQAGIAFLFSSSADFSVVVNLANSDATGNHAVTGFGFQPAGIEALATGTNDTINTLVTGAAAGIYGSSGYSDGTDTPTIVSFQVRDNRQSTDTRSASGDGPLIYVLGNTGSVDWDANLNSVDSDGLTINVTTATGVDKYVVYLGFGPGSVTIQGNARAVGEAEHRASLDLRLEGNARDTGAGDERASLDLRSEGVGRALGGADERASADMRVAASGRSAAEAVEAAAAALRVAATSMSVGEAESRLAAARRLAASGLVAGASEESAAAALRLAASSLAVGSALESADFSLLSGLVLQGLAVGESSESTIASLTSDLLARAMGEAAHRASLDLTLDATARAIGEALEQSLFNELGNVQLEGIAIGEAAGRAALVLTVDGQAIALGEAPESVAAALRLAATAAALGAAVERGTLDARVALSAVEAGAALALGSARLRRLMSATTLAEADERAAAALTALLDGRALGEAEHVALFAFATGNLQLQGLALGEAAHQAALARVVALVGRDVGEAALTASPALTSALRAVEAGEAAARGSADLTVEAAGRAAGEAQDATGRLGFRVQAEGVALGFASEQLAALARIGVTAHALGGADVRLLAALRLALDSSTLGEADATARATLTRLARMAAVGGADYLAAFLVGAVGDPKILQTIEVRRIVHEILVRRGLDEIEVVDWNDTEEV